MNRQAVQALVLNHAINRAATETRFSGQQIASAASLLLIMGNAQSHLYAPEGALVQVLLDELIRRCACTTCKGYGKVRGEMTDAGGLHQPPEYAEEECEDCGGGGYVRRD